MAKDINIIHLTDDEMHTHLKHMARLTIDEMKPDIQDIKSNLYLLKKWLSEEEASKYTGVPKSTLQKDRRAGLVEAKMVGKTYVYTKPALDAYLDLK